MSDTETYLGLHALAMAPGGPSQGGSSLMGFLPMILLLAAMYFLLIAPQRKKQKQHAKMIKALEKGTKIKTIGGVYGTITNVKEDRFILRVDDNVKLEVAKEAVADVIN